MASSVAVAGSVEAMGVVVATDSAADSAAGSVAVG